MRDDHGSAGIAIVTAISVAACIATILGFLMDHDVVPNPFGSPVSQVSTAATASGPATPGHSSAICSDQHVSLSRGSGPSGTEVTVTGTTFPADQQVTLEFSTEELPPARTDDHGRFQVTVVIPGTLDAFAPRQVAIIATTTPDVCFDSEPFELTRS
jgi:hypothetical protein